MLLDREIVDGSGADHFAHEGMTSTVIAGHYNMAPKLGELIMQNKIKAYNLPQGTLSQLYRDIAAKKLGTLTHVGLYTFCRSTCRRWKIK